MKLPRKDQMDMLLREGVFSGRPCPLCNGRIAVTRARVIEVRGVTFWRNCNECTFRFMVFLRREDLKRRVVMEMSGGDN
jgi:transcriptional regulator NrdR family protein